MTASALLGVASGEPDSTVPNPTFLRRLCAAAAAILLLSATARAEAPERSAGALLLRDGGPDPTVAAPLLGADYDVAVNGPIARARVTQLFHNPTDRWLEAVYVHPLPEGAAIDALKLVVGDRIVVGEVRARREARVEYERARTEGRRAGLLEQERPNLFTSSVANIGPGESVLVQIEYQETVRLTSDGFSLRLPLVVAPRYSPPPQAQMAEFQPGEGAADPVPDRERIAPPALDPRFHAPVNPVSVSIRLQAGFPLGEVRSHHHEVEIEAPAPDRRLVRLKGVAPADRDFELTWRAGAGDAPAVGLFRERVGGADYLLAFVTPPAAPRLAEAGGREVVLVIDNSGSMAGASIRQAKASLLYALNRLRPSDRFNVIRFDHTMRALFPESIAADSRRLDRARGFVAGLEAEGGTEMLAPMQAALRDRRPADPGLRQVVFLTDGAIGDEQRLFEAIAAGLGRSRLFMVGIGSAPNSFLMARAAELGRGAFTHIGSAGQVDGRMRELFDRLEHAVVTDLAARFEGVAADAAPAVLPDLYRGEPVTLVARLDGLAGSLELRGLLGAAPWRAVVPLAEAVEGAGVSKLWARRKIAEAEAARALRTLPAEEADARILALALEHGLASRLTSFVALDRTPVRAEGAPLARAELPLNLPAGWDFDKVFGPAARRAEAAPMQFAAAPSGGGQVLLPQTGTDAGLRVVAGLLLCAAALTLTLARRLAR